MTPGKAFIMISFSIKTFIEFFNSSGNSVYVLPDNGL